MKIAVYTIMKNEMGNLHKWLAQFSNADTINLLDTGSDDGSYEYVAELSKKDPRIKVHRVDIDPFDFSIARNMALQFVQDDYNEAEEGTEFPTDVLCLWLDLDERLCDDWYQQICDYVIDNNVDLAQPHAFETKMIFSRSANGNPAMTYSQRKFHTLDQFKWKYVCHELLTNTTHITLHPTGITVDHIKDSGKKRNYLPLLQENWVKHPRDLRALYYLAREYTYLEQWEEAVRLVAENVATLEYMVTDQQLVELYNMQANACFKVNGYTPEPWIHAALAIDHQNAEALLNYAFHEYYKQDTWGTLYWASKGLKALNAVPNQDKKVIYNKSREFAWQLLDLAAIACDTLGYLNEAVQYYVELHNGYQDMLNDADSQRIQQNILSLSKRLNLEIKDGSN
jgi:glycosyltransferase involved in cell wall biosynthesis